MTIQDIKNTIQQKKASSYKDVLHTEETYFTVGSKTDVVASNSFLSAINPYENGSFLKADNFFDKDEERRISKDMEKGKLLHSYIKNQQSFVIAEGKRPSDAVCAIITEAYQTIMSRVEPGTLVTMDSINTLLVQTARAHNHNARYGDEAILNTLKKDSGEAFFNFLRDSQGKVILTPEIRDSLEGMQDSLGNSEYADLVLHSNDVIKETPLFIEIAGVPFKVLIDFIHIKDGTIEIIDYKTTAFAPHQYIGYFSVGWINQIDFGGMLKTIPSQIYRDGSFQRFRTYRQMGLYSKALSSVLDREWIKTSILAIESKPPFRIMKHNIEPVWNNLGRAEVYSILDLEVKPYIIARTDHDTY